MHLYPLEHLPGHCLDRTIHACYEQRDYHLTSRLQQVCMMRPNSNDYDGTLC